MTPVFEPRRYDTRFFVAALPDGQCTRDVSTESDRWSGCRPRDAIGAVDDGEMLMLPPTYCTCLELVGSRPTADALAAAALPRPSRRSSRRRVVDGRRRLPRRCPSRWSALRRGAAARMRAMSDWAGGTFGERARCVLAPNPG